MTQIKNITSINEVGVRALNEDKILADEAQNIFGVFDGASSLDSYVSPDGKTGAYVAADIAQKTFAVTTKSLAATAVEANQKIEAAHAEAGIDTTTNLHRFGTTVAVARLLEDSAELLQIGDSVILTVDHDGNVAVPLGYHDHDLGIMRQWRTLADQGKTNIRQLIDDDLLVLRESSNIAYGVLNGDSRVETFTKTGTISLEGIISILILTDGMYLPKSDPDSPEGWAKAVELYKTGGLKAIHEAVRELELSDPDLTKYPRYKMHDDSSAVAIDLA